MTPLAFHLTKQLVLPVSQRHEFWRPNITNLRNSLYDVHCFEVTEVLPMVSQFGAEVHRKFPDYSKERSEFLGRNVFLPAPKTWIEWRNIINYPNKVMKFSIALLLEEIGEDVVRPNLPGITKWARATVFSENAAGFLGHVSLESDDFEVMGGKTPIPNEATEMARLLIPTMFPGLEESKGDQRVFHFFLSLPHNILPVINTPKIIGRKQHLPHTGLQRRLLGAQKVIGKFPLRAWTEIKLHIEKPIEIDDGEPHEAHLTGRRALHFCRKHIRIRLGRLEYVSAHWRGDPAIGIKQSRYKVVA